MLDEINLPKRIFIGGLGRSGTTILYEALGCHQVIHSLPIETRFIVDPDGLRPLVDALTLDYSTVQGMEAIFRFERLMRRDLATPQRVPFLGYDLPAVIGKEYYFSRLDCFCRDIISLRYAMDVRRQPRPEIGKRRWRYLRRFLRTALALAGGAQERHRITYSWPREEGVLARYFADRSELIEIVRTFVDDLFTNAARTAGKLTWCEKTPTNLFYFPFIRELFPNALFVHIKRDPRGVLYSTLRQPWGPNTIAEAAHFSRNRYDAWLAMKPQVEEWDNYMEVKLESLAKEPNGILRQIASKSGVAPDAFIDVPAIELRKVDYWRRAMSEDELQEATDELGAYIERMDYAV